MQHALRTLCLSGFVLIEMCHSQEANRGALDNGSASASKGPDAGTLPPNLQLGGAGAAEPASCRQDGRGLSDCGHGESCCTSLSVPGGAFYRSDGAFGSGRRAHPATLSGFRLDKYEVTVGRFRQFVNAVVAGWLPQTGSGKHMHLNGGLGLRDSGSAKRYESGWGSAWNANLATTTEAWNRRLRGGTADEDSRSQTPPGDPQATDTGDSPNFTWTPSPAGSESVPIGGISWYEAYAFCIWDGAFLPSDAEWNYAARGGSEQRVYPWSTPPSSEVIDCSYANYVVGGSKVGHSFCASRAANRVGSESPKGDGKWGQSDLSGNVSEWTLDPCTDADPCVDCASLHTKDRGVRGGNFLEDKYLVRPSGCGNSSPLDRQIIGTRCARMPEEAAAALGEQVRRVVRIWNDALDSHDVVKLEATYGSSVRYYGRQLSGAAVLETKRATLSRTPVYHQEIVGGIETAGLYDGSVSARFQKRSGSPVEMRSVEARLVLRPGNDGAFAIVEESDDITDIASASTRPLDCQEVAWRVVSGLPAVMSVVPADAAGMGPDDDGDGGFSMSLGLDSPERFEAKVWYAVDKAGQLTVTTQFSDGNVQVPPGALRDVQRACAH